jgi:hypothetical protein
MAGEAEVLTPGRFVLFSATQKTRPQSELYNEAFKIQEELWREIGVKK